MVCPIYVENDYHYRTKPGKAKRPLIRVCRRVRINNVARQIRPVFASLKRFQKIAIQCQLLLNLGLMFVIRLFTRSFQLFYIFSQSQLLSLDPFRTFSFVKNQVFCIYGILPRTCLKQRGNDFLVSRYLTTVCETG